MNIEQSTLYQILGCDYIISSCRRQHVTDGDQLWSDETIVFERPTNASLFCITAHNHHPFGIYRDLINPQATSKNLRLGTLNQVITQSQIRESYCGYFLFPDLFFRQLTTIWTQYLLLPLLFALITCWHWLARFLRNPTESDWALSQIWILNAAKKKVRVKGTNTRNLRNCF